MRTLHWHPTILVLTFLLLTLSLSYWLSWFGLAIVASVAVLMLRQVPEHSFHWWRTLWRLKWFWLSLLIVFGWWTPGAKVVPELAWSPSWPGLQLGLQRILLLLVLMLMTFLLCRRNSRTDLVTGINGCLSALHLRQVWRERFVLRLLLTLEAINSMQQRPAPAGCPGGRLHRIAETGARLLDQTLATAANSSLAPVTFALKTTIPWRQWWLPLGVVSMVVGLYRLQLWVAA